jgi:hypothetical protein
MGGMLKAMTVASLANKGLKIFPKTVQTVENRILNMIDGQNQGQSPGLPEQPPSVGGYKKRRKRTKRKSNKRTKKIKRTKRKSNKKTKRKSRK